MKVGDIVKVINKNSYNTAIPSSSKKFLENLNLNVTGFVLKCNPKIEDYGKIIHLGMSIAYINIKNEFFLMDTKNVEVVKNKVNKIKGLRG